MKWKIKFRYHTKLGKWLYSRDAEDWLIIFSLFQLALAIMLLVWDTWFR